MPRPSPSWWGCSEGWLPALAQSWPSCTAGPGGSGIRCSRADGQTVKQSRLCLMSQGSPALGLLGELSGGGVLGEGLKAMQRLRFLIHLGLGRLHLRIPFSAASEPG